MPVSTSKTDNHNVAPKLALRRYFLNKYHSDGSGSVMDCCQGGGIMWTELRKTNAIASYWGVDVKPKKGRLKLDSVRILQQRGWPQDVIDVDTYGSPWKHWFAIMQNIEKPLTVFLTVGSTAFSGSTDKTILQTIGCVFSKQLPETICGRLSEFGTSYALAKAADFCTIIEAVESVSDGNARYFGVRLEPQKMNGQPLVTASRSQHTQSLREIEHV